MAWQQAMDLVELVYQACSGFLKAELYGLTSQIRRAVVSVAANIAEGQGGNSKGEFIQFLGHAKGSLVEVETHLLIALRLKYVTESQCNKVLKQTERVGQLVNGLQISLKKNS